MTTVNIRKAQQTLLACYGFTTKATVDYVTARESFLIESQPTRWQYTKIIQVSDSPVKFNIGVLSPALMMNLEAATILRDEMREAVELIDGLEQIAS